MNWPVFWDALWRLGAAFCILGLMAAFVGGLINLSLRSRLHEGWAIFILLSVLALIGATAAGLVQ